MSTVSEIHIKRYFSNNSRFEVKIVSRQVFETLAKRKMAPMGNPKFTSSTQQSIILYTQQAPIHLHYIHRTDTSTCEYVTVPMIFLRTKKKMALKFT